MPHSNIHTHTVFSDGKNTPEEIIETAINREFISIGISDHSFTDFDPGYCLKTEIYPEYRNRIAECKKKYADSIEVLCGMEKDFFSPIIPEEYDYVIGSCHYLSYRDQMIPLDLSLKHQTDFIEKYCGGDKNEMAKRYFELIVDHARSGAFSVQGHFDIINKFGLFDDASEHYRRLATEAVDAVLAEGLFIEVNTGALSRGYSGYYPAPFLLEHLATKGARLVLGSDCHRKETIDFAFSEVKQELKTFGFSFVFRLRTFGFEEITLD